VTRTAEERDAGTAGAVSGVEIKLEHLSKHYSGQEGAAVDDVSMHIPAGEITIFVGPSGCGKTTTMKMINRLIEPSSGTITIGGQDALSLDPDKLRRTIGYAIQQAGLFPHMTVAQNVGMVPSLLGWPKKRIADRVDEMLDLVGLDPGQFRDRFPRRLSGGQQQRVGVARALAADPPVLLMDEPFGAVDPITRGNLQDELMRLQTELHKTIVFVTHDFDEAVKLGDRIAILQEGSEVVQYDTPEQILAAPANDFVEGFVGSGAALKQLTLTRVRDVDLHEAAVAKVGGDVRSAVTKARELGRQWVIVLDEEERPQRWVAVDELERSGSGSLNSVTRNLDLEVVNTASTLQDALDEMLTSSHGVVVVTGRRNRYEGVIRVETIMGAMQSMQSAAHRAETVTPTGAHS
jgi:osmoprotectant transport system ATP-binding protein